MIAQFTHGALKKEVPQVEAVRYSSPMTGRKEKPRIIDQRNFVSKATAQMNNMYSTELQHLKNQYENLKVETEKVVVAYDAAVKTKTLGRDRSLLSENAWHLHSKLNALIQQQQNYQFFEEDIH